jgi:hypothetical protein
VRGGRFLEGKVKWTRGIFARGAKLKVDGSLSFKTGPDEEVGEKLIKLCAQTSEGSFQPTREHDELMAALGNPEHVARTQGKGLYNITDQLYKIK